MAGDEGPGGKRVLHLPRRLDPTLAAGRSRVLAPTVPCLRCIEGQGRLEIVVAVAQLVRAPGCGPGGRGFKSPRSPFFFRTGRTGPSFGAYERAFLLKKRVTIGDADKLWRSPSRKPELVLLGL